MSLQVRISSIIILIVLLTGIIFYYNKTSSSSTTELQSTKVEEKLIDIDKAKLEVDNSIKNKELDNKQTYFAISNKDVLATICIQSDRSGNSYSIRMVARKTWLSPLISEFSNGDIVKTPILYFFVIGTNDASEEELLKLKEEQSKYNDLLLVPMSDRYAGGGMLMKYMMLMQTVINDLKINSKFFIRLTHDGFVNLPLMIRELEAQSSMQKTFWGYIFKGSTIIRDTRHKNGDMNYDVCEGVYNPYMSGAGWTITLDIAKWLIAAFPITKSDTPIEIKLDSIMTKGSGTIEHPLIQPKLFVNDDVNFGLILSILNIDWKNDYRYVPILESTHSQDVIKYVKDSGVIEAGPTHEFYTTYKNNLIAAVKAAPFNEKHDKPCKTNADKFFCHHSENLLIHVHDTHTFGFHALHGLLGGCRCKK